MEHAEEKLPLEGKVVTLSVNPYEIKTLRLVLRVAAPANKQRAPGERPSNPSVSR
jgi:hypothetical protein